jgi:hypothetical protein
MLGVRIRSLFFWLHPNFVGIRFSNKTDLDLIFAEESGHARFKLFPLSQSISLCDVLVFFGSGSRIRDAHVQPARECPAGLRQEVWAALLGVPRVLADAELFWTKVQG